MTWKPPGPPKGVSWVWVTRDLLRSHEWQSLSINARRLIDFLLIEHMNKAGAENGFLLAPRRQLEEAGIGAQYISGAIEEAEIAGLVAVKRGIGRRPNTYALKWLPLGKAPKRRPQPEGSMTYEGKSLRMTYNRKSASTYKGKSQGRSDLQREVTTGVSSTYKGKHPSISSYHQSSSTSVSCGDDGRAEHVNGPPRDAADLDSEVLS